MGIDLPAPNRVFSEKTGCGADAKAILQIKLYPNVGGIGMEFIWLILIGITVGLLSGQFMTGKGFGVIGDLIAGAMGALTGGFFTENTGIFAGSGLVGSLIVGTLGAIVLLYAVRQFKQV